ncbi:MAG: hypothetical protein WCQ30_07455 [Bacteroidales bacterium]
MDVILEFVASYAIICIVIFLFFAILWFIVLLIFRPLVLWYLNINTCIRNQEETNAHLSNLVSQNEKLLKELSKRSQDSSSNDTYKSEYEKYMQK